VVRRCAERTHLEHLAPHDLRRTCAKLCHTAGGEIEQIQFLLRHASVLTTERYLGCKQNLEEPVNDRFGRLFDARTVEARQGLISLFNLRATCHRPHDRLKYYPPLQELSAVPAWLRRSEPRLRYSPGLTPTTRLNALLNAASDS
jgi:hypothetical protein